MVERQQSRRVSALLIRSSHAGPSYFLKMKACCPVGEKMVSSFVFLWSGLESSLKDILSKHQLAVFNESCLYPTERFTHFECNR